MDLTAQLVTLVQKLTHNCTYKCQNNNKKLIITRRQGRMTHLAYLSFAKAASSSGTEIEDDDAGEDLRVQAEPSVKGFLFRGKSVIFSRVLPMGR